MSHERALQQATLALDEIIQRTVNPAPTNMSDRRVLDWVNGKARALHATLSATLEKEARPGAATCGAHPSNGQWKCSGCDWVGLYQTQRPCNEAVEQQAAEIANLRAERDALQLELIAAKPLYSRRKMEAERDALALQVLQLTNERDDARARAAT